MSDAGAETQGSPREQPEADRRAASRLTHGAALSRGAKLQEEVIRITGITPSGAVLLVVAAVSWTIGYVIGGRPLYLLAYGMLAVGIVVWILGRRPLALEATRSDSRPRLREGERIDMEVTLRARRRLATFVIEEKVPERLGRPARVAVASLASGEDQTHTYTLQLARRGVYRCGPLVAKWGDPLGLTQREVELVEPFEVLVHPSTEVVSDRPLTRMFEDPPIRPPISKPWPSGGEFYGMRPYQPGDDVRKVVWRAYARTGKILVRESEQGITDKITIILDQHRKSHSRGMVSESFEAGIRAAASLGIRHMREGYAVRLEGSSKALTTPLRGATAQMSLLDALARAELEDVEVTEPIMRLVMDPQRDSHIVVITPLLDANAASRLQLLLNRGASVLVAALMWDDHAVDTLGAASVLGCQVVEIRPDTPLSSAFRAEIGAGQ